MSNLGLQIDYLNYVNDFVEIDFELDFEVEADFDLWFYGFPIIEYLSYFKVPYVYFSVGTIAS